LSIFLILPGFFLIFQYSFPIFQNFPSFRTFCPIFQGFFFLDLPEFLSFPGLFLIFPEFFPISKDFVFQFSQLSISIFRFTRIELDFLTYFLLLKDFER